MKINLTGLEADLIVYALIHVKDVHDKGELFSSFISARKRHIECLIKEVNEKRNEEYWGD